MLGAWGSGILAGRSLDYEGYLGLYLNLERARLQRAVEVALGIGVALGSESLSSLWADALAWEEEEVAEVLYQLNKVRQEARIRRKLNWPSP
jgi:hypothetical protein